MPATPEQLKKGKAVLPLSITVSVIAVATAALQSAKALYDVIDGLTDAPDSVSHSKSLLSQTQATLNTLTGTLKTSSPSGVIGSVVKDTKLDKVLESTESLCQKFTTTLTRFTSPSTDSGFSKRDRIAVPINELKIKKLNRELADFQRTITMVSSSITM